MTKKEIKEAERFAIFTVHGQKCYLCTEPIDYLSMEIDHILPEKLLEKEKKLKEILYEYGLPDDFDINSIENFLPSCRQCNNAKKENIFNPTPIVQRQLEKARSKSKLVKKQAKKHLENKDVCNALAKIKIAKEKGNLSYDLRNELIDLVMALENENQRRENYELNLSPSLVISRNNGLITIKGPFGIGSRPVNPQTSEFDCPNCGTNGFWEGARCVMCGQMSYP